MANVLVDPGFEAESWTLGPGVSYASGITHTGSRSLELHAETSEPAITEYAQSPDFLVVPDEGYTLSFWWRVNTLVSGHRIAVTVYRADTGAALQAHSKTPGSAGAWFIEVRSAPISSPYSRIYLRVQTVAPSGPIIGATTWYVDDFGYDGPELAAKRDLRYPEESPGKPPHRFLRSAVDEITGEFVREDRLARDRRGRNRARADIDAFDRDELYYSPKAEQEPPDP